ncbi:hypothetical protein G9P44_003272 [Scheffersomyces stipitis]|nr:hypothetical protein G9P44_003272 [Scheffersomyces stipitis]
MRDKLHVPRSKQKVIVYAGLVLWLICVNLWIFNYYHHSTRTPLKDDSSSIYDEYNPDFINPDDDKSNKPDEKTNDKSSDPHYHAKPQPGLIDQISIQLLHKQTGVKDTRKKDSHSTVYDVMFNNHEVESVLANLDFQDRCELYFTTLYTMDVDWWIDPKYDFYFEHRDETSYDKWKKKMLNDLKKEWLKDKGEDTEDKNLDEVKVDQDLEDFIKKKYYEFWDSMMKTEQVVTDYLSHMRIFNKCFVSNDNAAQVNRVKNFSQNQMKFMKQFFKAGPKPGQSTVPPPFVPSSSEKRVNMKFENCAHLEKRLYPWLSLDYPVYERWSGNMQMTPPDMSEFIDVPKSANLKKKEPIKSKMTNNVPCFLNTFKNSVNSKGLVMSISDEHVDETVRFIHLLRALNNKYPIEIVYYDNLSKKSKSKLVTAAREKFVVLPKSFEKVHQYFPDDYMDNGGLPQQEIWFVNVHSVVAKNYKDNFKKFSNKFLATMFNSFEEFILVDADTVFVQSPEFFFELNGYKEKGAYFYRDRTAPQFRPPGDSVFFQKTSPSIVDSVMFDIPIMTDYTIKLPFFDGMSHFMESGVVVLNRNRHFNSILLMMQMSFMRPVMHRLYGDKELFFLSFAANGDEDYVFNSYSAAAIGQLTDDKFHVTSGGRKKKAKELCAAHPGHINGEDGKSLAWFNSGYNFCSKDVNFEEEFEKGKRFQFLKNKEAMETFYRDPMKITHAIIPPFKNKKETLCDNVDEEPKEGWHMDKEYCKSYLWCAYSQIGGRTSTGGDNTQTGYIFEFDDKAQNLFEYYGDIWVGTE